MATTQRTTGARTGEQYLAGLRDDEREIWLEGERITDPSAHPKLEGAARSLARLFDLQHEDPGTFLMDSPDTGQPVSVTHVQPKSRDDLERPADREGGWGTILKKLADYLEREPSIPTASNGRVQ